jgi:hypothetical protein
MGRGECLSHYARPEIDSPVNPYSLLEAVNNSSDTAHTAWLIFLGLMTYLMIAVAGVTHRDLLLETPVSLPLLQVSIPQSQFFQFAPVLLVLLHLGVVSQLVLLARKTLEFDQAVQNLEATDRRTHPLRLELHNFFFVQAVAGPHRSFVMSAFLHGMSWLTLVVLPVILLLYIKSLPAVRRHGDLGPSHGTAGHIGMLLLIGIFLTRAEPRFRWRSGLGPRASAHLPRNVDTARRGGVLLVLRRDHSRRDARPDGRAVRLVGRAAAGARRRSAAGQPDGAGRGRRLHAAVRRCPRRRHAVRGFPSQSGRDRPRPVTGTGRQEQRRDATLRDRDLRYAKLDRTDFRGADLTNADLDGASLVGANLARVRMQCADIAELYLSDNRAAANCVSARGTNFTRAAMKDARLAGIDARGAGSKAILEAPTSRIRC